MNNERYNQIIDDVFKKYLKDNSNYSLGMKQRLAIASKEEFINRIKTDSEFSEKWGLKIEERELSWDERFKIAYQNLDLRKKLEAESKMLHFPHGHNKVMDDVNIPTKLLTITYNNETIEVYE